MENASELLQASLSPLQTERENATAQLTQFLTSNPSQYLISLSNSLVNNATPSHIRNAAGLAIKNTLSARESSRQEEYALRWKALDSQTREKLKADALASLAATDRGARNVAGQVVAAIATIELPAGLWNGLIANLLELVGHSDNTGLRQATLQAIGYICESIVSCTHILQDSSLRCVTGQKPEVLAAQSNEILTAVVSGARKEETRYVTYRQQCKTYEAHSGHHS